MAQNPTAWRQYRHLVGEGTLPDRGDLNRFAARFSMARQLVSVEFTDLRPEASAGYTEGLRVALAYSALESLEKALDKNVGGTVIVSSGLAHVFRSPRCDRLRTLLLDTLDGERLKSRIAAISEPAASVDVRPVAQGMRHLVFHGAFTPHGSGTARSVHVRRFVADLGEEVLARTDRRFTEWLQGVMSNPET